MTPKITRLAALISLAGALPAAAATLDTIHQPSSGWALTLDSHRRSLAVGCDGTLWSLVYCDAGGIPPQGRQLRLYRSGDGGVTWTGGWDTVTDGDRRGAIVTGTDCHVLHVLWDASHGPGGVNPFRSVYYQKFDTQNPGWIGTPTVLAGGLAYTDEYSAHDLEITPHQTLVAVIQAPKTPVNNQLTLFSAYLMVKKSFQTSWTGPYVANTGNFGWHPNVQCVGEVAHVTYRSTMPGNSYGIFTRALDTNAATPVFTTGTDVPIGPGANVGLYTNSSSSICADTCGNLYVAYATNTTLTPTGGQLRLAYAAAPAYTWTEPAGSAVADPGFDPFPDAFNWSLSRGPGDVVYMVYSKYSENFVRLYTKTFWHGTLLSSETTVATDLPGRFDTVNGSRQTQAQHEGFATVSGFTTSLPNGRVSLLRLGSSARTVTFGANCLARGAYNDPLLTSGECECVSTPWSSWNTPNLGSPFTVVIRTAPPFTTGFIVLGTFCYPVPIDLTPFGFTGCKLYQDVAAVFPFAVDAFGQACVTLPIPFVVQLVGWTFYLQAFVAAPGVNPGGGLLTNSLAATIDF